MPRILTPLMAITALVLASPGEASAQTAFKTGERTTGMTKQCIYRAPGGEYTRTVSVTELCPLSIQVETTRAEPQIEPARVPIRRENAGRALGRGLRDLGATLQRERDAATLRQSDSVRAEIYRFMAEVEAEEAAHRASERARAEADTAREGADPLAGYTPNWRKRLAERREAQPEEDPFLAAARAALAADSTERMDEEYLRRYGRVAPAPATPRSTTRRHRNERPAARRSVSPAGRGATPLRLDDLLGQEEPDSLEVLARVRARPLDDALRAYRQQHGLAGASWNEVLMDEYTRTAKYRAALALHGEMVGAPGAARQHEDPFLASARAAAAAAYWQTVQSDAARYVQRRWHEISRR